MTFMGVDQSLTHTGVVKLDGPNISVITTIVPGELRGVKRLCYIRDTLKGLLFDVSGIAMEGYSFDSVMGGHQLGEVGGVLKMLFEEMALPVISVAPAALKKFATGNSKASKEMMMREAPPARDDHQADAYHLARVARLFFTGETSHRRCELEVLRTLKTRTKKKKRRARNVIPGSV